MKCAVHEDREAARALNVPCAPSGRLWVCDECFFEKQPGPLRKQLFDRHVSIHLSRVNQQRSQERARDALRN